MENREDEMVDIPGEFMHSDMECETVHMKLEGKMAELLKKLYPKLYWKYATNKKGGTVLYVELKKTYTERSRQHSYSGENRPQAYRSGGSQ